MATAGPRRARTWGHNGRDSWVPGCRERGAKANCRKFQRKAIKLQARLQRERDSRAPVERFLNKL
eukprot:614759-Pyramimonas_sp.AAC.1